MVQTQNFRNLLALKRLTLPEARSTWMTPQSTNADFLHKRASPPDRSEVDLHMKVTPRFLFRAWSPRSGGDKSLNTEREIRPAFFHPSKHFNVPGHRPSYTDFYQIPTRLLELHARLHLRNVKPAVFDSIYLRVLLAVRAKLGLIDVTAHDFDTYYSSWTQSLAWALSCHRHSTDDLHISILDTAHSSFDPGKTPVLLVKRLGKVVGISNHTFRQALVPPGIVNLEGMANTPTSDPFLVPGYNHEFLAFGPIHAPAFQTISWAKLQKAGIEDIFPRSIPDLDEKSGKPMQVHFPIDDALKIAKACAQSLDGGFDLAFMAHLMGICHEDNSDHDRVLAGLSAEIVSERLCDLPSIDPDNIDYDGHLEALRGDQILRDLVIGRFYKASTKESRDSAEMRRGQAQKNAADSVWNDTRATVDAMRVFMNATGLGPMRKIEKREAHWLRLMFEVFRKRGESLQTQRRR